MNYRERSQYYLIKIIIIIIIIIINQQQPYLYTKGLSHTKLQDLVHTNKN